MEWEDQLDIGELSDVGMRRRNNQDSSRTLLASTADQWRSRGHVFLVADGMGAHAVGELASKLAVDSIPHSYHKLGKLPYEEAIAKAFQDANSVIYNRACANRDFQGMGTTSTALVLLPEGAIIAHVGDSRAYRVRGDLIEQLSFDHSLAWELVRRRQLTIDQARELVPSNVITRSLGPEAEVQVDVEGPHQVQPGDVFVLCSDGLSGQVSDADIGILAGNLPAQDACQYLVDLANLSGGPDNITVIVVRAGDHSQDQITDSSNASLFERLPSWVYVTAGITLGIAFAISALVFLLLGWLAPVPAIVVAGLGSILVSGGATYHVISQRADRLAAENAAKVKSYRRLKCVLEDNQLRRFLHRLQQIRDLAVEQEWDVDWAKFYTHQSDAAKYAEQGQRPSALKQLCEAFHLLADAQRRQKGQTEPSQGG